MSQFGVQVFARAPVPGACKTRLMPVYGAAGAAQWHRNLVRIALHTALQLETAVELWCAPDTRHPFFRSLHRQHRIPLRPQRQGDLGTRMIHALNHAQSRTPGPWLLIGTDCPALNPAHLQVAALQLARGADCVLQPASDGGFVLIGTNRPLPPQLLRGVDWSSGQEFKQSVQRIRGARLELALMETLWDVDHPQDVRRARQQKLLPPLNHAQRGVVSHRSYAGQRQIAAQSARHSPETAD
ncbi:TIGR04282 family arsenosugar biosynthesis glycosyltransferase [Sinimarinibacterium sp. CAU 1509]|uniref:TIGR04282 family arsenosugar biosynthesis glycosyltransferase n=1 Tax=Sinimarinibacterium sp. CAU 1509 TaxID=2562283 RepID=UPI00146C9D87|nr:TIGR04282 family arsenosugar biosynthesis glycosyltransferase [Sinimarinibacterium sp. CAU 1509]